MVHDIIVIGGGAAGVFAAIIAKENYPDLDVLILERSKQVLSKVKISGGGRCNVTHHCFDPKNLALHYPRGSKELISIFYRFCPTHMIAWLENEGVTLKTEQDGRMFPITNSSQTIIDAFLRKIDHLRIPLLLGQKIEKIHKKQAFFEVHYADGSIKQTKKIVIATGSNPVGYEYAKLLGHTIVEPIPSLFTFHVPQFPLASLSGIAVEAASIQIEGFPFLSQGPLLITHFGFSGPATLKLSAFAARYLHEKQYQAKIRINWLGSTNQNQAYQQLLDCKKSQAKRTMNNGCMFGLAKNFWKIQLERAFIDGSAPFSAISKQQLEQLAHLLTHDIFPMNGKSKNKEEFVTCGGIDLKEINCKTMESKIVNGLYFAGEILNIDGITGGFNFQNAWSGAYILGSCIGESI